MKSDPFLKANEAIENAIGEFRRKGSKESLMALLDAIRERMHKDGHFIFPVVNGDGGEWLSFGSLRGNDGRTWYEAFTSEAEYSRDGSGSEVVSYFIDSALKMVLESPADGLVINPWGEFFLLEKNMVQHIFDSDGGVEYTVPDVKPTPEMLLDGTFLKRAVGICHRNRTELNMLKLLRILRYSFVWVPCDSVMGESDMGKLLRELDMHDNPETLVGKTFTLRENMRLIPDILQSDGSFFFPVFTSESEMGEYGKDFSKIEIHFMEALRLARENKRDVEGIVIDAFTEPVVIGKEAFGIIEEIDAGRDEQDGNPDGGGRK